ncbi:MAG: hypothetical protein DRJ61_16280, partial [Acidobacteria bacterium]
MIVDFHIRCFVVVILFPCAVLAGCSRGGDGPDGAEPPTTGRQAGIIGQPKPETFESLEDRLLWERPFAIVRDDEGSVRKLNLLAQTLSPEEIDDICAYEHLEVLLVGQTNVVDGDLKKFAEIETLKSLGLRDTAVTDDGLRFLAGAAGIEVLMLARTEIGDEGVAHLANLHEMTALDFRGT